MFSFLLIGRLSMRLPAERRTGRMAPNICRECGSRNVDRSTSQTRTNAARAAIGPRHLTSQENREFATWVHFISIGSGGQDRGDQASIPISKCRLELQLHGCFRFLQAGLRAQNRHNSFWAEVGGQNASTVSWRFGTSVGICDSEGQRNQRRRPRGRLIFSRSSAA